MTESNCETGNVTLKDIFALVDDLFFVEKIRATGKGAGIPVEIMKSGEDLIGRLRKVSPGLVIVDLNETATNQIRSAIARCSNSWLLFPRSGRSEEKGPPSWL